jgi:hypothetical protein
MNATQYNRLNELLSQFSTLTAALEGAEAEIKTVQLAAAQELLPKHAAAKVGLASIEGLIRKLCDEFYEELFPAEKRSHKTPFGEVMYRKSSSLEFDDEEQVVLRIDQACEEEEARALAEKRAPLFTVAEMLRTKVEPNLEGLESLTDAALHLFGLKREHKDNFAVKPFAMKTDKPIKKPKV